MSYDVLSTSEDTPGYYSVRCAWCKRVRDVDGCILLRGAWACQCNAIHEPLENRSFSPLSLKFVQKYMRFAQKVAKENTSCYARQIGITICKVHANGDSNQIACGYNGPPKRTPHCDSAEYLRDMVWPLLSQQEKEFASQTSTIDNFVKKHTGCKTCPRRIVGAKSGERLELCSCEHAEANAIYNAGTDLHNCWMFCWCGVPCWDCTKAIINAGITHVFCLADDSNRSAYQTNRSRFLFEKAGISLFVAPQGFYLNGTDLG